MELEMDIYLSSPEIVKATKQNKASVFKFSVHDQQTLLFHLTRIKPSTPSSHSEENMKLLNGNGPRLLFAMLEQKRQ